MSEEIKEIGYEDLKLPQCCTENWSSCPHTVKQPPKVKKQIAL